MIAKIFKWIGIVLGSLLVIVAVFVAIMSAMGNARMTKKYDVQVESVVIPTYSASIEQGRKWSVALCASCHGVDFSGKAVLDDPAIGFVPASNLTAGLGGAGAEFTDEDLSLAKVLLAERSAEDIAAALARLYRSSLPAPEDILDPGEDGGRSRHERGRERSGRDRPARHDFEKASQSRPRPRSRDAISEGAVWFSAAIGRRKNADVRWLLPMICRRGGIDKHEIGKINIFDTTTEFEIDRFVAAWSKVSGALLKQSQGIAA